MIDWICTMSLRPTRRTFLQLSAAGCAVPLFAFEEQPSWKFPSAPRDRIAVTSYPFRAYIQSPTNRAWKNDRTGMNLTAFAAMIADKFGVFNINPLGDHFSSTDPAYLDRFRQSLVKARSHIVDLGLGGREFYSSDAAVRAEAVAYSSKWIEIAAVVGSPSVRQHVHGAKGAPPNVELAAQSLGKAADFGAKHNVVINLENDDAVSEDPFFLTRVIETVRSPYLRALPDFGNSLPGHDAAFNHRAVQTMLRNVFNMCHVKENMEADGKHYKVDLAGLFALARGMNYRGYFSMECESEAEDPFDGTKRLIAETVQYLS